MARKIRKGGYIYWKHPTAKGKYVKAKELPDGRYRIVEVVPASKVRRKRGG